jgi:PA14 domain
MIKVNKNSISILMLFLLLSSISIIALGKAKGNKSPESITSTTQLVAKGNKSPESITSTTQVVAKGKTPEPTLNNQTAKWHIPTANYRMVIKSDKPELSGYIDLSRYCLPEKITNGIDIRDTAGKKLLFKLFPDNGLLIDAVPDVTIKYIYFGFKTPLTSTQADNNKKLDGTRLKLTVINGRLSYLTGDEWIKDQQKRIIRNHDWREKHYTKLIDQYLERGILPRLNFALAQCSWWDLQFNKQLLAIGTYQQYDLNWRPPNSYFIDLRRLRKYNILLYHCLYGYFGTISWRVNRLRTRVASQEKQLAKLPKLVKDAPKKAFIKLFDPKQKRWKRKIRGTKAVTGINLERRPFDSRRNFGAIFSGKIVIKEAGEYQFAINSTSSIMLKIDGMNVFTWLGAHDRSKGWGEIIKTSLSAGLHDLKLNYHKASGFTHATLAWKPPGETAFRLMNENDFAPGWINVPLKCNSIEGKKYPIIKRTTRQLFFIGKRERAIWTNFKMMSGNAQNYTWKFKSKPVPQTTNNKTADTAIQDKIASISDTQENKSPYGKLNREEIDVVFNSENDEKVIIADKTNQFATLELEQASDTQKVTSINPDLNLKLWLPTYIYDDELLNGQIEISSSLPEKINCTLVIEANRKNSILPTAVKRLTIPAKPLSEQHKFSSNSVVKNKLNLNGEELISPLDVKLSLQLPGMIFSQKQLRFIPLKDLPELQFNGEYLTDKTNNRVIPVLHRPSLSELRSWELPLIVHQQLYGTKKITLIADDFGLNDNTFANAVKNKFAENEIELNFQPWHKHQNGFAMLNSLPSLLPEIDKITSDTVILIPPNSDLNGIASVRVQGRTIAALLERLRNNQNIRKIYLAMPFPTPSGKSEREQQLNNTIQKLCRTYDIYFIDLNSAVRGQKEWEKAYRINPENPAFISPYPLHLTDKCTDILNKHITE